MTYPNSTACQWDPAITNYIRLRAQLASVPKHGMLFENSDSQDDCQLREHFLQAIWNEQCFTGEMQSTAKETIEVVAPGTWNLEPGPDFRNAVLRIGDRTMYGDVEIHRNARDWDLHGHTDDPNYDNVILHAVWNDPNETATCPAPCFVMKHAAADHWRNLAQEVDSEQYPYARQVRAGLCAVNWGGLTNGQLRDVLRVAGLARFHEKAVSVQVKIIARGVEQAAYEALFRALGYKKNQEPMELLAKTITVERLRSLPNADSRSAVLFGAAGLLPDPTRVQIPESYRVGIRKAWDIWWSVGMEPLALQWSRAGLRPYNFPERRLAAGCSLLEKWQLRPARMITGCAARADSAKDLLREFAGQLQCQSQWEEMTSFTHRLPKPAALIGERRADDIVVNAFLPLLCACSRQNNDTAMECICRDAFLNAGKLQQNRPITEVAHRLLVPPSRAKAVVKSACEQQGMLSLYRDFCLALYGNCRNCPLAGPDEFEKLLPGE